MQSLGRGVEAAKLDHRRRADGASTRGLAGPSAAAREGLRRHGGSGAGFDQTRRQPAVMAVEVISDELVARGVDIAAQVSADAARELLASAAIAGVKSRGQHP